MRSWGSRMQQLPLYAALFSVLFGLVGSVILARGAALASPAARNFGEGIDLDRTSRNWLIPGLVTLLMSCALAAIAIIAGLF